MMINNLFAFGLPQGPELFIILFIILLLFGGAKIPQLMRGLGRGMGELQEGLKEGKRSFEKGMNATAEENPEPTAEPKTQS